MPEPDEGVDGSGAASSPLVECGCACLNVRWTAKLLQQQEKGVLKDVESWKIVSNCQRSVERRTKMLNLRRFRTVACYPVPDWARQDPQFPAMAAAVQPEKLPIPL